MAPSNAYHLIFELYPTPTPTSVDESDPSLYCGDNSDIWLPAADANIFDDLPCHQTSIETKAETTTFNRPPNKAKAKPVERHPRKPSFSHGLSGPGYEVGLDPVVATQDWRFGRIQIASFDMAEEKTESREKDKQTEGRESERDRDRDRESHSETHTNGASPAATLGPMFGGAGQMTRGRYKANTTEAGWGIVHLYREGSKNGQHPHTGGDEDGSDGTILCIPAVPSYLTPRDFLGFVGETWTQGVSHYRMVMTSRTNRYMVLLKFRDGERARDWREAFDGRVFNSMEAEICHVSYIQSITIARPGGEERKQTEKGGGGNQQEQGLSSMRPFPPPTPNLIEMPTCPVCLERMDDTSGLMTILCQHVFHCTCLQTWKGSGCPVCRATNPLPGEGSGGGGSGTDPNGTGTGTGTGTGVGGTATDPDNPFSRPFGADVTNLCSVCDCPDDLWICLLCGYVGCGRYKRGHAKDHWKETAHSFSLELETQHVWDYAGDEWVHRLLRNKGDGKVVELPGRQRSFSWYQGERSGDDQHHHRRRRNEQSDDAAEDRGDDDQEEEEEVVPRAKLDNIGMEYTHLLTSQLESQRIYFEEMVSKAASKAAKAAAAAESAAAQATQATQELRQLRREYDVLAQDTVPSLERDLQREQKRSAKATALAQTLNGSLQEERQVSAGLMRRIEHLQSKTDQLQEQLDLAQKEKAELEETNHDLTMFISSQEKLQSMAEKGELDADEVEGGTVSVAEKKKGRRRGGR